MKLSPLLAQFLYLHKELTLAGIGRFRIISPAGTDVLPENISTPGTEEEIIFNQDIFTQTDPVLVSFISAESGKMKSLAAADLDSYLELAKQFLNIGKPFLLEGIGTLSKNKKGLYDFIPWQIDHKKGKEHPQTETDHTSTTEDSFKDYEEMFSPKKSQTPALKKIVLWLAVLSGIGITIWGGYMIYSKSPKSKEVIKNKNASSQKQEEKTFLNNDTLPKGNVNINSLTGQFKFVIEKAGRTRALTRYNDLRNWGISVQMETQDSVVFKLYFVLPASAADTARIKDSLTRLYGTMGNTTVEH